MAARVAPVAVGRVAVADGVDRLHRGGDAVRGEEAQIVGVQELRVLDAVRDARHARRRGQGAQGVAVGAVADGVDGRGDPAGGGARMPPRASRS